MKNKLLTLCTFLFIFVCVVKGQSYKQLTSETIIYTTNIGNISDVTWMGGKAGTTVEKDFKANQNYVAQDDVIVNATSTSMLTIKPATNARFISFYVTGVSKVYAYGIAPKKTYGISIEGMASDATIVPEMVSAIGEEESSSVMAIYPASGDLDPLKSYIITVRGVNSDSYLYAVRFETSSGPSTDNTLHSLTVNGENVEISDAMEVSIPYTYTEATVPVAFEVDAAATVKINNAEATGTVAAPDMTQGASVDYTITVTAEDGTPKDYTLTIRREVLSNIAALGEVKVGDEIITYPENAKEYTYPTPLPFGTLEFPVVTATASRGGSVSSIVQATIDNPVATIHILAEDREATAAYTINFLIADPIPAKMISEGVVRVWNLTVWSEETLLALGANDSGWTTPDDTRFQNSVAYDAGNLKVGSTVITELSGLSFPKDNASKTSIRFAGPSLGLQLGGAREVTLDEVLKKGQTVRIVLSSPNTTSRGIESVTNLEGAVGDVTYGTVHVEYNFTVSTDGIVKFKSNNGIILEKIEVLDLTSQALTAESLSSFTDVKLSGDITAADIAILNAASLTSIDLTETSSIASGLNPQSPNCLAYANSALENVRNLVVNGTAEVIELMDGYDFNNPKEFKTSAIKYTRYLYTGWNTVTFPFPYRVNGEQIEEYGSANETTVSFVEASATLIANQAYLIYMDADNDYVFEANGEVTVPVTETVGEVFKSNFRNFKMAVDNNLYKLNNDGTVFNHSDGEAVIGAFRGYLDLSSLPSAVSNTAPRRIVHGNGGATSIADSSSEAEKTIVSVVNGLLIIRSNQAQYMHIYGIDGRMVRIVELKVGENIIDSLSKGIYLIGNRKVVL